MFDLLLFDIVTANYDKIRFCNLLCSLRFKHGRHLSLIFDWKIYTFFCNLRWGLQSMKLTFVTLFYYVFLGMGSL